MSREIDRSPSRVSTVTAVGAGFVAAATSALVAPGALLAAVPGMLAVFLGLYRGSRRVLSVGVMGLLGGSMFAGAAGAPPLVVLCSVTAAVLTWDYASTAISVGRQLGRRADTARLERTHTLASLGVAAVTIVVSFGVFRSITGTHPVATVFFLLLAALLLVGALR
ncbi:MAG: hypothetical protein ABEH66_08500 [Halobacteriales archaeon]